MSDGDLNEVRYGIMETVEDCSRVYKMFLVVAALVELICLVGFFWLMDFGDRLHWLLLVTAFLVYGTLAVSLMSFVAYNRLGQLQILRAIEALCHQQQADRWNATETPDTP